MILARTMGWSIGTGVRPVGDLNELGLGKGGSQSPTSLDRHHFVPAAQATSTGLRKRARCRLESVSAPPAFPGGAGVLAQVPSDVGPADGRLEPPIEHLVGDRVFGHQAAGRRKPAQWPDPSIPALPDQQRRPGPVLDDERDVIELEPLQELDQQADFAA